MTKLSASQPLFTSFTTAIDDIALPERFTYPYKYKADPLCEIAAGELQRYLATQTHWQFADQGKMFGVLVVKNVDGEVGYLSAFSGHLPEASTSTYFVPGVFDKAEITKHFAANYDEICELEKQLKELENSAEFLAIKQELALQTIMFETELRAKQAEIVEARKQRKKQRQYAEKTLTGTELEQLKRQLNNESVEQKKALQQWKAVSQKIVSDAQNKFNIKNNKINNLKTSVKVNSQQLSAKVNSRIQFKNTHDELKSLDDIFAGKLPVGAGECTAVKLLNFAFETGSKPLAFAQFWWGPSPRKEVRHHGQFYPACRGRCKPILQHMLQGLAVDDDPLPAKLLGDKSIDIVYQDEVMLVINKPADFLSVPGSEIEQSVYSLIKEQFPDATGPLIVHRLDMATSGLMAIALTKDAHKQLQQQFINRTVGKRYVALLDGLLETDKGGIDLPLRVDLDDRPRQVVCYDYGRSAVTEWQVIEKFSDRTRVHFYPKTGRSHQLRMHAAHTKGLSCPIRGDELYGKSTSADRLHLHADWLELNHPVTQELMTFHSDSPF